MEYYGIIKKQKLWLKLTIIILGIYIIYSAIVNNNWGYFPVGLIMILATFSNKKHIISKKGIDILYVICGFEFHNLWNFKEINMIYTDFKKSKPNVELHIAKDLVFRKFILTSDDASKALDIILKINPNISIKEITSKN